MATTNLVLMIISLGGREHQEVGFDLTGENLLGGLVVEIDNKGQRLGADELGNILLGQLDNIWG